jgi:hypothetical protein
MKSEAKVQNELTKQVQKADDLRNTIRNDPSGLNAGVARVGLPIVQKTVVVLTRVLSGCAKVLGQFNAWPGWVRKAGRHTAQKCRGGLPQRLPAGPPAGAAELLFDNSYGVPYMNSLIRSFGRWLYVF